MAKKKPVTFGDLLSPDNPYRESWQAKQERLRMSHPVGPAINEGDNCSIVEQTRITLPEVLNKLDAAVDKLGKAKQNIEALKQEYTPVTQEMLIDWLPDNLRQRVEAECADPNLPEGDVLPALWPEEILGEEADVAMCEDCNTARDIMDPGGVTCGNCGGFFCRHVCWAAHWCGVPTDRDGNVIQMGDKLIHSDGNTVVYEVCEMAGTFTRLGIVRGRNRQGEERPIRPRLMTLID